MNVKVEQAAATSSVDVIKYIAAAMSTLAGLGTFYWFGEWPGALRAAILLVALIVAGGVFALTARGRTVVEFLSESRFELRKVVWPTRQETVRATGVIIVVVIVLSLVLAFIDFILSSVIRWLLGG